MTVAEIGKQGNKDMSSIYAPEFARLAQVKPMTELEKLFTIELPVAGRET